MIRQTLLAMRVDRGGVGVRGGAASGRRVQGCRRPVRSWLRDASARSPGARRPRPPRRRRRPPRGARARSPPGPRTRSEATPPHRLQGVELYARRHRSIVRKVRSLVTRGSFSGRKLDSFPNVSYFFGLSFSKIVISILESQNRNCTLSTTI